MNCEGSITIFDGNSRLTLTRLGEPEEDYPASSYPTRIQINSGPFSTYVEAPAQSYLNFRKALLNLHETLSGQARLEFWNQVHLIILTGEENGSIKLTVKIADSFSPSRAKLTVEMGLDQSYLPKIIAGLGQTFPKSIE